MFAYNQFLSKPLVPHFVVKLLYTFYRKPFIKFFKNLVFTKYGLVTSNFTKSLIYYTVKRLESMRLTVNPNLSNMYLLPIPVLNFSFHKSTYNTLIIYILYLLTHSYINNFTNFSLWYSYIIVPKHFQLLNFCNNYYFKLHHY